MNARNDDLEYFCLVIFDGNEPRCLDLDWFPQHVISFGRAPENDVVLPSPLVSRRHGCLVRADGGYSVEVDPRSTNGVFFDGRLISRMELRDGDCLGIDRQAELRDPQGVLLLFSLNRGPLRWWKPFPLEGRSLVRLGRDPFCDLALSSPGVSRLHAVLERRAYDWILSDNDSTNGILLNGRLLHRHTALQDRDVLVLGGEKLVYAGGKLWYETSEV